MKKKEELSVETSDKIDKKSKSPGNGNLSPLFVEAEKLFETFAELSKTTAERAFENFKKRDGEIGKEFEDWFRAESEILRPVPVEITEQNGDLDIVAAVPGYKPEDIKISVTNNLLIMHGKTEESEGKRAGNVVYSDFKSDHFFRKLTLPSEVDADQAEVELKDGFLHIKLPKMSRVETKQIAVSVG
jgi:HSP20 family protein